MDILESDFLRGCLTPYAAAVEAVFDKRTRKDLALRLGSEEAHLFDASYSGNTVGSYAGRIRNARLRIGDDLWMLDRNDGPSSYMEASGRFAGFGTEYRPMAQSHMRRGSDI